MVLLGIDRIKYDGVLRGSRLPLSKMEACQVDRQMQMSPETWMNYMPNDIIISLSYGVIPDREVTAGGFVGLGGYQTPYNQFHLTSPLLNESWCKMNLTPTRKWALHCPTALLSR